MDNKTREITLLPNGTMVEYTDDDHKYYVDGKELPSITTLISHYYGNMYDKVNPDLLKASAEYGTRVHNELSNLIDLRKEFSDANILSLISDDLPEVSNYFRLVEKIYNIVPEMSEKVVTLYDPDGKPVACGRFDLLCYVRGELTLADFKTTSVIHRESVSAQLNLYAKAALQSGYISEQEYDNLKLGVIHLHGSTAKYAPIMKFNQNFYLNFII